MNPKPGYKTTEFWMTILTNIVSAIGGLSGVIPAEASAIIIAVANGVYGILRVFTKAKTVSTSTTFTSGPAIATTTTTPVATPS